MWMDYLGLRKFKLRESLEDVTNKFPIGKDHACYLFFIDIVAVGVIEAKNWFDS